MQPQRMTFTVLVRDASRLLARRVQAALARLDEHSDIPAHIVEEERAALAQLLQHEIERRERLEIVEEPEKP